MKTKLHLTALACLFFSVLTFAQAQLTPQKYDEAKKNGTLKGNDQLISTAAPGDKNPHVVYRLAPNIPVHPASNSCQCWQTRDSSWDIVPITSGAPPDYRNDDGSTALISIPFSFCLYGTTWTDCYINNNGNVSFGSPYSTFTASGFPVNTFAMVAPFWADVDTRNFLSGLPHYKITSTYMVVQWDSVGYYDSYADKVNTFQLIITNGTDPIVPGGNVSFCYKDMQWTTGDASNGVNGFNGADAVVGANKGDGVNYIQFGEFNQPGSAYGGPSALHSGIDWLDYRSFIFDACTSTNNVPPTPSGITICDTLRLCIGDTLPFNVTFFSPEVGQNTVITIDTTGTSGFVVISNTPGNTASLSSYFVGSASNAGYNTIIITATDNGSPAAVTNIPIIIQVSSPPVTTISNDTTICPGGSANLVATGGPFYSWSPAASLSNASISNPVATPSVTTTYTVTISGTGCDVNRTVTVTVNNVSASAGQDATICLGESTQLNATGGNSYSWTPTAGLNNPNIPNPVASPTVTTTYTCTVTNATGCTATDDITVTIAPSPTSAFSSLSVSSYPDSTFYFTDLSTGGAISWFWLFGDGGTSNQQNPTHTYSMSGAYNVCLVTTGGNGCSDTACSDVNVVIPPVFAPNVFTPDNDGTNDLFVFTNLEYYHNAHLVIYDRWGVRVYQSDNYQNDWNGKKMETGGDCADGTYYYILSGSTRLEPMTGFVELIRGKK